MNRSEKIPLKNIMLKNGFLGKKNRLVIEEVIPYQWAALNDEIPDAEPSRAIENFRIAAGKSDGEFHGMVFQDSDVAKWLEAAACSLAVKDDPELRNKVDLVVELIKSAQEEDGYLNTYFSVKDPTGKWKNLAECHELYCSGHMLEAAVALQENCNDSRLLEVMKKNADLAGSIFGPQENKKKGYPGHQEIELALVRLYRLCGDEKYLDLAAYFIDERGKEPFYFPIEYEKRGHRKFWEGSDYADREYSQTHLPVREQKYATGHAVRAMYMYCAMADLALEKSDDSLAAACRILWENVTEKQMYITGGTGPSAHREAFTADYDLPNETAYNETCAAIGFAFWAWRMLQLDLNGKYSDVLEKLVYNGIPCGMSADGRRFFYVNPLQIGSEAAQARNDHKHVKTERQQWFGCACCPPNIARFFASAGQYICSADKQGVYIHLYEESEILIESITGAEGNIELKIATDYPWNGSVSVSVSLKKARSFMLSFRVPGWCQDYSCSINGRKENPLLKNGYVRINRNWENGDRIELVFNMPVRLVRAHPLVQENAGKVAVQKGPVVYCLEEADNGKNLAGISISTNSRFSEKPVSGKNGKNKKNGKYLALEASGKTITESGRDSLYEDKIPRQNDKKLIFVPYYYWGNRGPGEMRVWIREEK